jgi:hypothetical protein
VEVADPAHAALIRRLVVPGAARVLAGPGLTSLLYAGDGAATVDIIDPTR